MEPYSHWSHESSEGAQALAPRRTYTMATPEYVPCQQMPKGVVMRGHGFQVVHLIPQGTPPPSPRNWHDRECPRIFLEDVAVGDEWWEPDKVHLPIQYK